MCICLYKYAHIYVYVYMYICLQQTRNNVFNGVVAMIIVGMNYKE